ncbi:MAG: type II secretion system inner membrane protein GspF [Pseudomonadota bacterium]
MPSFEYVAVDTGGRRKKGVLDADNAKLARRELRKRALSPVSVAEAGAAKPLTQDVGALIRPRKLTSRDLVLFTRQLATLVAASVPVEESLRAVAGQTDKPVVKSIVLAVRGRVAEGRRMSDALAEHPASFSPLYRSIVAAGETSGELGAVLERLADMLEKTQRLRARAVTAAIYPAALALVAIVVVIAMLTFVVPKVVDQFTSIDADLPAPTAALLAISNFLQTFGPWLLGAGLVAAIGLWRLLKREKPRRAFDRGLLGVPLVGRLVRGQEAAQFARTLATLTAAGAPLLDGMRAATRTVTNTEMAAGLKDASASVGEGVALSAALGKSKALPSMAVYMIAAGERSGDVAPMLTRAADQLESEFERVVDAALKLMEPAIIIVMGGVVLFIVLAILSPVLSLNTMAIR